MPSSQYHVKVVKPQEMTSDEIAAWVKLESSAIESNAFLSPFFILPAAKYLEKKNSNIFILSVTKVSGGTSELTGIFPFKIKKFSKHCPLPHISAFHSRHSYLSGILANRSNAKEVVQIIFNFLSNFDKKRGWPCF